MARWNAPLDIPYPARKARFVLAHGFPVLRRALLLEPGLSALLPGAAPERL